MKFEEKIKAVLTTLDEDLAPVAGNPAPNNPAQVAPQQGQQPQQGADQQNQEITAEQMLDWAMQQDPKTAAEFGKLQGDAKFQAVAQAMMAQQQQQGQPNNNVNPAAASNGTQTTSAAPAATNTSGTMGAGTTQV